MNEQRQQLYRRTALLSVVTKQQGNVTTFDKAKKFGQKLFTENLTIAFAGHFSAGKSSMINALTGENLLATSPIPTSANIVTIQKATNWKAYIHFMNGDVAVAEEELAVANLKRMAKDGQSVRKIELFHPDTRLPNDIVVMDTPGVDSTDDAHRLSTESELHLADLVFYVMDYNHVQSELNFTFTKDLMRTNPNVYLIINQMDKHREQELSLEAYKQSVKTAFESWGVHPKGIFFTSLRDAKTYPVKDVQDVIQHALENKETVLEESTTGTLQKLIDEHATYLKEDQEDLAATYEELFSPEEWLDKKTTYSETKLALQSFELLDFTKWKEELQNDVQEVLSTAYLMTPDVRERIRLYAEASQPGFKVGFFGAKKKTEEERDNRLKAATQLLQEVFDQTTLPLLQRVIDRYARVVQSDETYISFKMDPKLIATEYKPGTSATGDGLLQFSSRIEQAIKRFIVQTTLVWADERLSESDGETILSEDDQLKKQSLTRRKLALDEWFASEERLADYSLQMKSPNEQLQAARMLQLKTWEEEYTEFYAKAKPLKLGQEVEKVIDEKQEQEAEKAASFDESAILSKAQNVTTQLADIPNFKDAVRELKQKIKRVTNRSFTIALFGAFSAGKSSFSNALLGDAVLPVSPNPTTASINKIAPIAEGKPHRHADVAFKKKEDLLTELKAMVVPHGKECQSLEEFKSRANEFLTKPLDETKKSFIRAFLSGSDEQLIYLGTTRLVDHENFTEYVAVESKSCFVETITYYYDCELTRAGVTLVDTPGADSINARHTGVAFDYIRNADAVLFITYYNHAFAKADREFLIQLGRVKDSFELDKMFFVVNAIDLASSEQEKQEVIDYVGQELTQFGIRFPRLYGVSSLQALKEKQTGENLTSGMPAFSDAFQAFLRNELLDVILQAVSEQADELVEQFSKLIDSTEENMLRKPQRLAELAELEQQLRSRYTKSHSQSMRTALLNEVDTLIYYLKQRLFYRYPDFFKEAFNPLRFASKDGRQAFEQALREVAASIQFDAAQELRVTNLRLQQATDKNVRDYERQELAFLYEQPAAFAVSPIELKAPKLLEFQEPTLKVENYSSLKSGYKNAKRFFEKNEKQAVQQDLERMIKDDLENPFAAEKSRLRNWTDSYFSEVMDQIKLRLLQSSVSTIQAERELLEQHETLTKWKQKRTLL